MVDVLESHQGYGQRSLVSLGSRIPSRREGLVRQRLRAIKPRTKFVCYNIVSHRNNQRVMTEQDGPCPQCGQPLVKLTSRLPR